LDYLDEYSTQQYTSAAESLIKLLYGAYMQYNPVETQKIRDAFQQMYARVAHLPYTEIDFLFQAVNDLYQQVEEAAFLEGIRVGARLAVELSDPGS